MTYTATDLRKLADHIESGAALCKSDYAGSVHLLLREASKQMDELAEMKALANHETITLETQNGN